MVADGLHEGRSDSLVDLVDIDPELIRRRLAIVLHRLHELVDDEGIIVDHHNVRTHHLKVVVNLIEPESLLLGILVRSCIVLVDTRGSLAVAGGILVALEAIVEELDTRGESGGLLEKVMGNLGVSGDLINVRADEDDTHLKSYGLSRINLFA
jgi:hypothetical protein